MALPIVFNNRVYAAGYSAQDDGAPSAGFGIDNVSTASVTLNGRVNAVGDSVTGTGIFPGDTVSSTKTLYVTQYDNADQIEFNDTAGPTYTRSSNRYIFSNTPIADDSRFSADSNGTLGDYNIVCFATGTRIRAVRDGAEADVAVEDLAVGDLAVTAGGTHRPIRWIGRRTSVPRRHARPEEVHPVRIRAGALGENRPARDLLVSPGHAIALDLLGEVLVPAGALVNGATIVQETVERVTYWHVELDGHDLLLAEGQPAESYLDMGNRGYFTEGAVVGLGAGPDAPVTGRTHASFCRPFHAEGPLVAFAAERLRARAAALGWRQSEADPWAGVNLVADGLRVEPEVDVLAARFRVPDGARDLWLVCPETAPRDLGLSVDARRLGLHLAGLSVGTRAVALDDALLCVGFHAVEVEADGVRRWTTGRARIPAALFAAGERTLTVRLDGAPAVLPRWIAPAEAGAGAEHRRAA